MSQEKVCGAAIIVAGITHDFRNWPVSVIEIAGKPGIPCQVGLFIPLLIMTQRKSVGLFKPGKIRLSFSRFAVINGQDHGTKKRGLGATQVISAIGVQHAAIVIDLKEKVLNHSFG